jgi:hypothetical protein
VGLFHQNIHTRTLTHPTHLDPEDGSNMYLRNVCIPPHIYVVQNLKGPIHSAGPRTSCRPNYSPKTELLHCLLFLALGIASLSEIYNLWTDCRDDTAFGIGCLAITRKRLPSGLGLARYQGTSTPRRARHNVLSVDWNNQVKYKSSVILLG